MPRPLIIKVSSHNLQSNNKATGSINVELIAASEESPGFNSTENNEETSGIVRNLVNKYESSATAPSSLTKYRSKSMIDLSYEYKPKSKEVTQKAQDDGLYLKSRHIDDEIIDEWRQNFQHALRTFQKFPETTVLARKDKPADVHDIREKAQRLLEATKHDYFWFNQVMELLQQIVNNNNLDFTDNFVNHTQCSSKASASNDDEEEVNRTDPVTALELRHEEEELYETEVVNASISSHDEEDLVHNEDQFSSIDLKESSTGDDEERNEDPPDSSLKVSEMTQMYEEKVLPKPHLFVEISRDPHDDLHSEKKSPDPKAEQKIPLKYFGKVNEESHDSTLAHNQNDHEQGTNQLLDLELSDKDDQQVYYNEDSDYAAENELEERLTLHTMSDREALKTVEEMIKKIEECDRKIDTISVENHAEANRVNDILIQVLIKLDDLKPYNDGVIVSMRRKAFAFTQDCIQKLKDKVFGDA